LARKQPITIHTIKRSQPPVRDWNPELPVLRFAADCRLSRTDHTDDQVWELEAGQADAPALAIQTQYGGRVGLARIVPMLVFPDRAVYEAAGYAEPFRVRRVAPNYALLSARPTPEITLEFDLWVMDSHAVGGRFTLTNQSQTAHTLRLELIPQIGREGRKPDLRLIRVNDVIGAVSFGALVNINPILVLEHSELSHEVQAGTPKVSAALTLPPGGTVSVRWVHVGGATLEKGASEALRWLGQDWTTAFGQIEKVNAAMPTIETGDPALDALFAYKMQMVLRAYLGSSGKLPHPSPIPVRTPAHGYRPSSGVEMQGQTAQLLWLIAPTTATLAPDLARGALRNMLAVRAPDGWIDWKPDLDGGRTNMLAFPLLASTAWAIYEATEDREFLAEVLPGLTAFFLRWFAADMDDGEDGAPEWTNDRQAAQFESALYIGYRRQAANLNINDVETPDLLALLLQEADALIKMAEATGRENSDPASPVPAKVELLRQNLAALWDAQGNRYGIRDRESHARPMGVALFSGRGDEWFSEGVTLDPPNRLIIRLFGGQQQPPLVSVQIEGVGTDGQPLNVKQAGWAWYYGFGSTISAHVYARVNYVKVEGLSKAYTWELRTADLTGESLPHYLPLRHVEHYKPLVAQVMDKYKRAAGLAMSADAASEADHHQIDMLWNALLIDALLERGETDAARDLIETLHRTELGALRSNRALYRRYHAETGAPISEIDDLTGILPLHLVFRAAGIQIVNSRRVWAGGAYALSHPITIRQHGITVTRSASGTKIEFPTGHIAELGSDAAWQAVEDPTPIPLPDPAPAALPDPAVPVETVTLSDPAPEPAAPAPENKIPVQVQRDPTTEVDITHIDFAPGDPDAPKTYKIKVKRTTEPKPKPNKDASP
jgi:hypothetical protein